MARIAYEDWRPNDRSLSIVQIANNICAEYRSQGYDLTLRQLYYQFVARDFLPNSQRSYDNLGATINKARLAGLLDWNYIVDRTRNLRGFITYDDPADLIARNERQFRLDKWRGQDHAVEVWVEKEALAGVISRAADQRGVNYFSCRGYVSQSELHAAAERHLDYQDQGKQVAVIHLGDHDPSGIDMTRDIEDRLRLFGANTTIQRIALNWDQVEHYNPPPNPAKLTDSRAKGYIAEYGASSWELDALDPNTLSNLIIEKIDTYLDRDLYLDVIDEEREGRAQLAKVSQNWHDVTDWLNSDED